MQINFLEDFVREESSLAEEISIMVANQGIPLLGFSDLEPVFDRIYKPEQAYLRQFPHCITLGTAIPQAVLEQISKRDRDVFSIPNYLYSYQAANRVLEDMALHISAFLEKEEYQALPLAAAQYPDKKSLTALFSHKIGATMSGLGWVGKSGVVITEEYGPRARFTSVLTDAPLPVYRGGMKESRCGSCCACVKACPVNAYTNRTFSPDEPREMRFDAHACNAYHRRLEDSGEIDLCGYCIAACPYGKKRPLTQKR